MEGQKMNEQFIVKCPECGQEHNTEKVQFLNVEEDIQGRDIFYYVCPITQKETKSLVYKEY
jgi:hypothetical protein